MRFSFRIGFVLAGAVALGSAISCDDDGLAPRDESMAGDAGSQTIAQDARADDQVAPPMMSTMRIAHLAPELGPIDFCYQAARSGTFVGPVLGGSTRPKYDARADADAAAVNIDPLLDAGDGGDGGSRPVASASYRTLSKYLNLSAVGPMTVAIVQAGATSCANAMATADVTLDPGKLSTVAVFRRATDGGAELEIAAFTDDRKTTPETARVRVIHAALGAAGAPPAGPLAVRVVATKTIVLTDRVEPRKASTPSAAVAVDSLGYVTAPPVPPPSSIAIGPASNTSDEDASFEPWKSAPRDLDLRGDSLHTAFILTGRTEGSFEVLWCADTITHGDWTTCEIVR